MLGRIFGNKTKLQAALHTRFGTASQSDLDAAKQIVAEANAASWTTADLVPRTAQIKEALRSLEKGDVEAKVRYIGASADLQIAKGSGLITYAALLCAIGAMMFQAPYLKSVSGMLIAIACAFSIIAALFTLCALWFRWPKNENDLATAEGEALWLIDVLLNRAKLLNIAVLLSILATVTLATGACFWSGEQSQQEQTQDQDDAPQATAVPLSITKAIGIKIVKI